MALEQFLLISSNHPRNFKIYLKAYNHSRFSNPPLRKK